MILPAKSLSASGHEGAWLATSAGVCQQTGIYRSSCLCRFGVFRRRGERLLVCPACAQEVGWELEQDLSIVG
jgi:hypothetical protein